MANTTFGRGACVAPYLQLSHFPDSKGCQYSDERSIGLGERISNRSLSRGWPIMLPGAIRRGDD